MKFQYIGDGNQAPINVRVFGHDFVLKGEPVEVLDHHVIKKLMGCPTFVHEPVLVALLDPAAEVPLADAEDAPEVMPEVVPEVIEAKKHVKSAKKGR